MMPNGVMLGVPDGTRVGVPEGDGVRVDEATVDRVAATERAGVATTRGVLLGAVAEALPTSPEDCPHAARSGPRSKRVRTTA